MFRHLITFLLLINIFSGYFAEASIGKSLECNPIVSEPIDSSIEKTPASEENTSDHSENNCLMSHCHFGHCAALKATEAVTGLTSEIQMSEFNPNLTPIDFVFNLLRPPISV